MATIAKVPDKVIEPPERSELPEPPEATGPSADRKPRWFPTAFTVLAAVLLLVSGSRPSCYLRRLLGRPGDGRPATGTYAEMDTDKSLPQQFYKLWAARTNGLYGIESEAGNERAGTHPDERGAAEDELLRPLGRLGLLGLEPPALLRCTRVLQGPLGRLTAFVVRGGGPEALVRPADRPAVLLLSGREGIPTPSVAGWRRGFPRRWPRSPRSR